MKELSNRYKVPEETLIKMVRDGVISTTWPAHEDIYIIYKKNLPQSKSVDEAALKTSVETGVSKSTVYNAIHKFL